MKIVIYSTLLFFYFIGHAFANYVVIDKQNTTYENGQIIDDFLKLNSDEQITLIDETGKQYVISGPYEDKISSLTTKINEAKKANLFSERKDSTFKIGTVRSKQNSKICYIEKQKEFCIK